MHITIVRNEEGPHNSTKLWSQLNWGNTKCQMSDWKFSYVQTEVNNYKTKLTNKEGRNTKKQPW